MTEIREKGDDPGQGEPRRRDAGGDVPHTGATDVPEARDWRSHLLDSRDAIRELLRRTSRIAVLGIKPEETGAPAAFVPAYAKRAGYEIIPVPVYYPDATEMLGERVYQRLTDIPGGVDMVNVFRRPADIPQHLEEILSARPSSVWMQQGIRNDVVAEALARAGIDVVQDRCLMVDIQAMGGRAAGA